MSRIKSFIIDLLFFLVILLMIQGFCSTNSNNEIETENIVEVSVENDSSVEIEQMVWIPTKGGKKYHSSAECSQMSGPVQVMVTEAISAGFTHCRKCY